MARHVVATTSEIPAGGNKVVTVGGREIVVFHVNGEFFALLNRCPHEGAPLAKAACVALPAVGRAGRIQALARRRAAALRLARLGVRHAHRPVLLRSPAHARARLSRRGRAGETLAKGPYVAETFPVTVEESYVLIEV